MPIAPENVSWVAWDAIRNEQAERKRQLRGAEANEGRAAKRARLSEFRVSAWSADGSAESMAATVSAWERRAVPATRPVTTR